MPDYQKCMIYKLICNEDPTFLYIGHTTNWNRRKTCHKSKSFSSNYKLYTRIRELGGWENIKMIWIEDYPCNNKREGESREQYWMDTLKPNMNMQFAQRDYEANKVAIAEYNKEYREANKEAINQYHKEYREANKEAIAEQHKEYYKANKDAIIEHQKEYYKVNKEAIAEREKEYRAANKEAIAEYKKEYREANKEKSTMKFECECGGRYTHQHKTGHFKTKMHQAWLLTCHE